MAIVAWGVKCAHKCGNGVRLAAGVELEEQIAALELSVMAAAIFAWLRIARHE